MHVWNLYQNEMPINIKDEKQLVWNILHIYFLKKKSVFCRQVVKKYSFQELSVVSQPVKK